MSKFSKEAVEFISSCRIIGDYMKKLDINHINPGWMDLHGRKVVELPGPVEGDDPFEKARAFMPEDFHLSLVLASGHPYLNPEVIYRHRLVMELLSILPSNPSFELVKVLRECLETYVDYSRLELVGISLGVFSCQGMKPIVRYATIEDHLITATSDYEPHRYAVATTESALHPSTGRQFWIPLHDEPIRIEVNGVFGDVIAFSTRPLANAVWKRHFYCTLEDFEHRAVGIPIDAMEHRYLSDIVNSQKSLLEVFEVLDRAGILLNKESILAASPEVQENMHNFLKVVFKQ